MNYVKSFISSVCLLTSVFNFANAEEIDQVRQNNAFAMDLYTTLKEKQTGNLFFSPYSISSAMAMVSIGAKGKTKEEIDSGCRFNRNAKGLASSFSWINAHMTVDKEAPKEYPQLHIANGIWMQVETPFEIDFVDTIEKKFKSAIYALNFEENPDESREEVNRWVEEQTKGKIKELFPSGTIQQATRLVLASTLYMKAPWKMLFDPLLTTHENFYLEKDNMTLVEMMNDTGVYNLFVDEQVSVLELPYGLEKGGESQLAMLVLVPKEIDGLAKVENALTADQLCSWIAAMSYKDVQVRLPKFKLEKELSLIETLKAMGIQQAFSHSADFSGITGSKDIAIDNILHKACLHVDENGTEAAAATGISVSLTSLNIYDEEPYYFLADHPFMFVIFDKTTGSILFMGRLVNPL